MGTLADSLFNVLMSWVRALVNSLWALFTTDHTTLLEFLGKNWIWIVAVILAAGLVIDWLVWLIRWQPYHLWARRARRFLHMPEPEEEEKGGHKKRAADDGMTQDAQHAQDMSEEVFEDEQPEEQWLPLERPQVDERQTQEVLQRAQSVPDEELGAYPGMRYGAKAGERDDMANTQRYSAVHAEGPGAAEVERRRAEIAAWQQQMAEEARQKAEAERAAREAERQRIAEQKAREEEQRRIARQKAYEAEQQRIAQQKAYEEEQRRIAEQKAYEAEQQRLAQEEYQRRMAEYERQKAQYELDLARYQQEKAAYDAEMARQAAQNEAVQPETEGAPRRRRAARQKPKTYSDYVSGETVEQLPDPPQWPQVQQAAEQAKKPKKSIMSRVAKMMEEDETSEIAGINALPPRVSKDEAYRPAKTPQKTGRR